MSHNSPSFAFQNPATNANERITELENNLLQVQREILGLKTALAGSGSEISSEISLRLATLESRFQELNHQFIEERHESTTTTERSDHAIQTLTSYFNDLDTQLKALHTLIQNRDQANGNRCTAMEVANKIRGRHFAEAETLMRTTPELPTASIVKEVYASSHENADILFDFVNAITEIKPAADVLNAMKYELRLNNHCDTHVLVKLENAIQKKVLKQPQCPSLIKIVATEDVQEIHESIINASLTTLAAAMSSNNYQNNIKVQTLAKELFNYNSEIWDKVLEKLVKRVFPNVSALKIADNIYSHEYISQIIHGLVALFRELKNADDLNNKAVFRIGSYLQKLTKMKAYSTVSAAERLAVNETISALPICAKNLLFEDKITIWSKRYNTYMYAACWTYVWSSKRSVFLWDSNEAEEQGFWCPEKNGDQFAFQNDYYKNEYLFASTLSMLSSDRRDVKTWTKGSTVGNSSAWNVELCGDYCYLYNEEFHEYLYASQNRQDENRRRVFTWTKSTSTLPDQFMWQIRKAN